jgi:hypothetical protein
MSQDGRIARTRSDLGLPGTGIRQAGYYDERVPLTFVSAQFRRVALKDLKGVLNTLSMRRGSITPSMPSPIRAHILETRL